MSLVGALSRCLLLLFVVVEVVEVGGDERTPKFTPEEMDEISLILDRGNVNDPRNLTVIEQLFSHLLVEELSDPSIRQDLVPIEHHLAIVKKMERLGRMLRDSFEYNEKEGEKADEYLRYFKEHGERRFADKHFNGAVDRRAFVANSFLVPILLSRIRYFFCID